jgi:hypothetical protein
MAWFGKKNVPQVTRSELERYGRQKISSADSADWEFAGDLELRSYYWAKDNSTGFLHAIAETAAGGGWAALGAARLQIEAIGFQEGNQEFDTIMRHALNFLRSRGIPKLYLTGYENGWWADNSNGEPWLIGRPAPDLAAAPITPLANDEMRHIADMGPQGNDNKIFVTKSSDGYKAVIRGRNSDEDPTITQFDWLTAQTLHQLYVRIGDAFATPKPWMIGELVPYIPLPEPDFT